VSLLVHFCKCMQRMHSRLRSDASIEAIYDRQRIKILKALSKLHEDIQYDFKEEIVSLGAL
jgi:hypothetical protein